MASLSGGRVPLQSDEKGSPLVLAAAVHRPQVTEYHAEMVAALVMLQLALENCTGCANITDYDQIGQAIRRSPTPPNHPIYPARVHWP